MNDGEKDIGFARRLGSRLKELRLQRGLTQQQVAKRLGDNVAVETISRFERGASAPAIAWVERLAEVYGVAVDEVFGGALTRPVDPDPERQALHDLVRRLDASQVVVVRAMLQAYVSAVAGAEGRGP